MKLFKCIQHFASNCALMLAAGCAYPSPFNNVSHIPQVELKGDDLRRYHDDVRVCQSQVMRRNVGKSDKRNQDRKFRECLINNGHMLLS